MITFEYIKDAPSLTIKIKDKFLELPDSQETTPYNFFDDILIFHIRRKNDDPEANIVAINQEGEVMWQFNECNDLEVQHRFMKPWLDDQGHLWVRNLAGKHYRLDVQTGELLQTKWANIDFNYKNNHLNIGKKNITITSNIKAIDSWRGEILLVMYGSSGRLDEGERVVAFDKQGDEMWDKGEETFKVDKLYGIVAEEDCLYVAINQFTHKVDYATGEVINTEYTK